MKSTDRFLIVIVIGILVLVAVAFAFALNRPEPAEPTYLPEDTPDGVVQNYLIALRQGDYARAHGYLSLQLPGYPEELGEFTRDIQNNSYQFRLDGSTSVEIISVKTTPPLAVVRIRETFFNPSGLFDSGQSESQSIFNLSQDKEGNWKIESGEAYWVWCWNDRNGCYK